MSIVTNCKNCGRVIAIQSYDKPQYCSECIDKPKEDHSRGLLFE